MAETFRGTLLIKLGGMKLKADKFADPQKVRAKNLEESFREHCQKITADKKNEEQIPVLFEIAGGPPGNVRRDDSKPADPPARSNKGHGGNASERSRRGEFRNPYNFVPVFDRDAEKLRERVPSLGDGRPAGHHRCGETLYSGTLKVSLTTATPVLLPPPPP